jgi:predicted AlkP superfamily pyrophosphatase or phosphodiesterase
MSAALVLTFATLALSAKQPLVVVSIDGLDNRYLAQADQLGLKIPHLRRLLREGQASKGVIGAVPTVTWPSHTSIITGADPVTHGILANWRPPGEKYLDYSQIKVPTLIGIAHDKGLKVATVNWPVTVNAPVDWNLPEFFAKRQGGGMDTKSIASKSKPADLVEKISADFPSFPKEFMDDRTRTQAVIWILQHQKPDLLLVHLVDLDSEEHENAPFSTESKAVVEYTDELLGQIMAALPAGSALAVVSDHGFEKINRVVNPKSTATDAVTVGGVVVALDAKTADALRKMDGVGREIPAAEYMKFPSTMPASPFVVFDSAPGVMFGANPTDKPTEIGNHGLWPLRYRAVYLLWGKGIKHETLPEISIKDIFGKLSAVLGL